MPPEGYEQFLKEFLYMYLLQHHFDPDKIFFDEIQEVCDGLLVMINYNSFKNIFSL